MSRVNINRRSFLKGSAGAALSFPAFLPGKLLGPDGPNDKVGIALLGTGSRGNDLLRGFGSKKDVRFVAVCDPFRDRREKAAVLLERRFGHKGVVPYADFRRVLDRKDIDAVIIATPDHWHVPLAIVAAEAGKDSYVEKPLGVALEWEWRLREAIERNSRVFQYGTIQRSSWAFRYACEIVRNGYLGKIKELHVWSPDGTRAADWMLPKSRIPEPVPDGFDFELWQGPAPKRPYNHYRVHREGSFHTYDYAIGFIAGWGAHQLDIAQWGMGMDKSGPVEVEGTGKIPDSGGLYSTVYDWDIQARYKDGTPMRFMSHNVARPVVMKYLKSWAPHGNTFFGEKGWINVDRYGLEASDPDILKIRLKPSDIHLKESKGQDRDFLDCVKSRELTVNPVESAIRSDTISHLSDIAIRTGRKILWDPDKEEFVGNSDLIPLLDRPMRAPYQY